MVTTLLLFKTKLILTFYKKIYDRIILFITIILLFIPVITSLAQITLSKELYFLTNINSLNSLFSLVPVIAIYLII